MKSGFLNCLNIALLSLTIVSCTKRDDTPPTSVVEALVSQDYEIIDLTHALSSNSPYWPNDTGNPFSYDTIFSQESGAPGMGAYSTPEHFGTHIDAPIHFADGQKSVHELMAHELFGPGVVIDVSSKSELDPDYLLSVQDIVEWENEYGQIPADAVVIMNTGWSKKWDTYIAYKNQDESGNMHFPGFSEEAAKFLVDERDIIGIGIDTFSVDAANADGFPVHRIVNGANKYHLENVANTHLLPAKGSYLLVAPIKLLGGSGGQVRIFALVE